MNFNYLSFIKKIKFTIQFLFQINLKSKYFKKKIEIF
jgi:hypothetical protein